MVTTQRTNSMIFEETETWIISLQLQWMPPIAQKYMQQPIIWSHYCNRISYPHTHMATWGMDKNQPEWSQPLIPLVYLSPNYLFDHLLVAHVSLDVYCWTLVYGSLRWWLLTVTQILGVEDLLLESLVFWFQFLILLPCHSPYIIRNIYNCLVAILLPVDDISIPFSGR